MTLSRTGNTINGSSAELETLKARFSGFLGIYGDHITIGNSINKRERTQIDNLIESINEEGAKPDSDSATTGRYVELLAKAERLGLNHGKAWFCTGFHVDRDSLDPSFEGEMVCYVYYR